MTFDLILKNGTVWTVGGPIRTSVGVTGGKIAGIGVDEIGRASCRERV